MKTRHLLLAVALLWAARSSAGEPAGDAGFEDLLAKVRTSAADAAEPDVRELLESGERLGRPFPVALAVKPYLTRNPRPSPEVLLLAARNARLVGDFRTAAARYKSYLADAPADEGSSVAAAELCSVLVDVLGASDDAYQWMREHGADFRGALEARKFDGWFLDEGVRRDDPPALARRLAAIMEERLPLEQERLLYWDHLDWLMRRIGQARREHFEALPHCRAIAAAIRGSRRRELRYGLNVAYLACEAGAAGKDEAARERDFARVIDAAKAYVDAFPTAGALREAVDALTGMRGGFDLGLWRAREKPMREFIVHAFDRLPDGERGEVLNWRHDRGRLVGWLVSGEELLDLAERHTGLFRKTGAIRELDFACESRDPALIERQARLLAGVPSGAAAVVNSLAASDDIIEVVAHLARKESWHLGFAEMPRLFTERIWRTYEETRGRENLPQGLQDAAMTALLGEGIARTPVAAFEPEAVKRALLSAWREAARGRLEKAEMAGILRSLDWVPWTGAERKDVVAWAYGEFRAWADRVRREKGPASPEAADIAPLDEAFKAARAAAGEDPELAPDALTRSTAAAILAARRKDAAAYADAARELYAYARGFEEKRTPWGAATMRFLLGRTRGVDKFDVLAEILAERLEGYRSDGPDAPVREVVDAIVDGRWGRLGEIPARDRERARRLRGLFEKALGGELDAKRFSGLLFDCVRATRRGSGWADPDAGLELFERMIRERTLIDGAGRGCRPDYRVWSGAVACMWLVRHEFQKLSDRYPYETWFDDMFVAEAERERFLDRGYWECGRDRSGKVAAAAARILGGFERLPFGYDDADAVRYEREHFRQWQERALEAKPDVREKLIGRAEAAFGRTRFDAFAMGGGRLKGGAFARTAAGRREWFRLLATYVERARGAPWRVGPPHLGRIRDFGQAPKFSEGELDVLVSLFRHCTPAKWWWGGEFENLPAWIHEGLVAAGREKELYGLVPHFWAITRDIRDPRVERALVKAAQDLVGRGQFDLAAVLSSTGMDMLGGQLADDVRNSLLTLRAKSMVQAGTAIPVPRTDPRYPVFSSQAAYLAGNIQSAWELYVENAAKAAGMFKELDPKYTLWLVSRATGARRFDEAEALARAMMQWVDSTPASFDPETRARLVVEYAGISFARQEYPRARAQYARIAAAGEFQGTRAREDAEVMIAEVDRLTRQYDAAARRLEKLARSGSKHLQTEAYHRLALVKYDQEEFAEAKELLDQVFVRAPDHAEARILEGQLYLKLRKLVEATEIKVGLSASRRTVVPGRPLRITLEDQNLSVVGRSSTVEIRVWTDSGDEETFTLAPFGDSKTRFQGQIATELAPGRRRDRTLQVLGRDRVFYGFTEAFRREHNVLGGEPEPLSVATDAELYVSSGRILSREEEDRLATERMIRAQLELAEEKGAAIPLSERRAMNQVKPGNSMNVRVVDPDMSATPERDMVTVKVATSSGDAIASVTLLETATHSGVFEGVVQTASARATAYATDSKEGTLPNYAISSGEYPPWVALPDNVRPKTFSVDLNDNVALGRLKVTSDVPGRKLRRFAVRTSLNGRDFRTVAAWPEDDAPSRSAIGLEMAKLVGERPQALEEFREYFDVGCFDAGVRKFRSTPAALRADLGANAGGRADAMRLDWNGLYVAHMHGWFFTPQRRVRTFSLERRGGAENVWYLLVVDGTVGPVEGPEEAQYRVRKAFNRGVARIDVYVAARRDARPSFEVLCDTEEPPYMGPCPADLFDAGRHPEIARAAAAAAERARVAPGEGGSTFDVEFPARSRARVIRLSLADFETDAPAVTRIELTDSEGGRVLPTGQDLMALRENDCLEIVPGDRITVTYEDPRAVSRPGAVHEAFMTATFANADVRAAFVEYTVDGAGERHARYVPMRRFRPGDRISVIVSDPDEDTTDELDRVRFGARTADGRSVQGEALETEPHSGVFVGGIFPVKGEPARASELRVAEGDAVFITYADRENVDYGIPWDRTCLVEQVWHETPEVRVYGVRSEPVEEKLGEAPPAPALALGAESVPVRRTLVAERPAVAAPAAPAKAVLGGPLIVEVLYPTIALSPESRAALYVQASPGKAAPEGDLFDIGPGEEVPPPGPPFDVKAPGTLKLLAPASGPPAFPAPPGYGTVTVIGDRYATSPLDDGRFTFSVPFGLGETPKGPLVDAEPGPGERLVLAVRGGDSIRVGFRYEDAAGVERWITRDVALVADVFFDVMDRRYREGVEAVHVGENAYFRVIHRSEDRTGAKDSIEIELASSSGQNRRMTLAETFERTGEFKGLARFVYAEGGADADDPSAMPVKYGDVVTVTYRPRAGEPVSRSISVFKGADGAAVPFTKRFRDEKIAMQTQFTVAEAYFELAKKHLKLNQEGLARREMAQARKLLDEAIRDYPDAEVKAQAEYLLADLTYEYANLAANDLLRKQRYAEAVARFNDIVISYPDSPYAPKAQFKKALVHERTGDIDAACEEYVKLSYRYPDNDLVAETIARLGQYFLVKGKDIAAGAKDEKDPVEREKVLMQSREMYRTSAEVFGRLAERFPSHRLAGKTTVLSAQSYMRAEDYGKAVAAFGRVVGNPQYEKEVRAEAMYWSGHTSILDEDYVAAYRMLKKLTWDFPESKWAKFARGRLTEPELVQAAEEE